MDKTSKKINYVLFPKKYERVMSVCSATGEFCAAQNPVQVLAK